MTQFSHANSVHSTCRDQVLPIDISVIIVTINAVEHIEDCLESLFRHSSSSAIEVIVSDNYSTDGTPELVREKFPQVKIIQGKNRGYGAGNNRGILISRGRYVLVLNDDTVVLEKSLDRMVAFMDEHPDVGMMGPRLLNTDGSLQPSITNYPSAWKDVAHVTLPRWLQVNTPQARLFFNSIGGFFPRIKLGRYDNHDATKDVDGVKGACMMVRRKAIGQAGMFDERIFLLAEESDWAYRMAQAGWRIVYYPEAEIVHLAGRTTGGVRKVPGRLFVQKHKSNLYFFEKHKGHSYALFYRLGLSLVLLIRLLFLRLALLIPSGKQREDIAQEREAFGVTFRLLWDKRFAKKNVFHEMEFDHL